MSIPVQDLGWMAGILDLKGRIVRKNNRQRRAGSSQIVLYVETKEFHVVRELARMTGTSPELQEPKKLSEWMRVGCTQHCPDKHVHVNLDALKMPAVARWTISGAAMGVVLYNLLPFIRHDRGFSEAMQQSFNQATYEGQGSGATMKAIARLHELGWDLPPSMPVTEERLALVGPQ